MEEGAVLRWSQDTIVTLQSCVEAGLELEPSDLATATLTRRFGPSLPAFIPHLKPGGWVTSGLPSLDRAAFRPRLCIPHKAVWVQYEANLNE